MDIMFIFLAKILLYPWVIGIGTAVLAGVILHYIFGIGRSSGNTKDTIPTVKKDSRQEEYEMELQSFRNDMVRRGLAHSSIRLRGEVDLKRKFGIQDTDEPTKNEENLIAEKLNQQFAKNEANFRSGKNSCR